MSRPGKGRCQSFLHGRIVRTAWLVSAAASLSTLCGCLIGIDDALVDRDAGPEDGQSRDSSGGEVLGLEASGPDGGVGAAQAACAAASSLRVASTSTSAITLAWSAAPGLTLTVSRKTYCASDPYVSLAAGIAGGTYVDTSVQPNWVYWYALTVSDPQGQRFSVAVAAQASMTSLPGCAGGEPPNPSGFPSSCATGDAGADGQ